MGKAAANAADDQTGELQQTLTDRARVHDLGCDDEERHREQHEATEKTIQGLGRDQPDVLSAG